MFDLAQKQHPSQLVYPRQGNFKLQLEFSTVLPEAVNVFTWAFYDAKLQPQPKNWRNSAIMDSTSLWFRLIQVHV
jgi:hypothetical protein